MTNATTIETITNEQIEELWSEAATAGDEAQCELCYDALRAASAAERAAALVACVEAIREAELS